LERTIDQSRKLSLSLEYEKKKLRIRRKIPVLVETNQFVKVNQVFRAILK